MPFGTKVFLQRPKGTVRRKQTRKGKKESKKICGSEFCLHLFVFTSLLRVFSLKAGPPYTNANLSKRVSQHVFT